MRLILLLALMALPAAARADNNPDFDAATTCASVFQPVCATRAGTTKTFPNACLAKGAGFTPVSQGKCGGATRALPRFCTKEYVPVCGERDGVHREFGNACEARAEDFAVVHEGRC